MPNGLHGLGRLEAAATASYMEPDEWSPIDPESAVHDDDEGLSTDVVPESAPEDDEALMALVQNFGEDEREVSGIVFE